MSLITIHRYQPSLFTLGFFLLGFFSLNLAVTNTAMADNNFNVRNVLYSFQDSQLTIFSQLDLTLSNDLIEAVNNGVTISIAIEYAKPKKNLLGTTYDVIAKSIYEIERHSLSNRYLMRDINTNKIDIFNSIQAALDNLGRSLKQSIEFKEQIKELAVRCYVDKFRLPGPLRFKALFSEAWSPSSDWSIWPLNS